MEWCITYLGDNMNLNPWLIGFLLAVGVIGYMSKYIARLGPNNPIEQEAEEIIKDKTGIAVELSGTIPEVKF